mgnify:CR=1 FL=1
MERFRPPMPHHFEDMIPDELDHFEGDMDNGMRPMFGRGPQGVYRIEE